MRNYKKELLQKIEQLTNSVNQLPETIGGTEELIAFWWVKWNAKSITGDQFAQKVGELLKIETGKAWKEHIEGMDDPLNGLVC